MMRATCLVRRPSATPHLALATVLVLTALLLASTAAPAATLNVPSGPYPTIQSAINAAAASGDTIQVAAGTYVENLVWNTKSIQLIGAGAGVCIVNGNAAGSCLRMTGVPSSASVQGFTFTNGKATGSGEAQHGGGIYCTSSSPTIARNTISGNTAYYYGGGFYCSGSSPTITGNTISGNTVRWYGGGVCCSGGLPAITGNTITGNTANDGGGIYCSSSPSITNNTISGNTASWYGGGIYCSYCSPPITGNIISGNTAGYGGGIYCSYSALSITRNTISGNTAAYGGGIWCGNSSPAITNTIIAFSTNGGGIYVSSGSPAISYCDAYGNAGGDYVNFTPTGTGNTSQDPLFANAAGGDFHLRSFYGRWNGSAWVLDGAHSPCIDAGDPSSGYSSELEPNGDRINMGAYGNTAEASKGSGTAPPRPNVVWVDDDWTSPDNCGGHTWLYDAFNRTQHGINAVASPGTVNVAAGTYVENLVWSTKDLQLIGAGAGVSIVNGNAAGSCLRMTGVPSSASVQGFTFTNGKATGSGADRFGGGIWCDFSSPAITGNIISGNRAYDGGGICCHHGCSPAITGNTISDNGCTDGGGGIYCEYSSPDITGNSIDGNTAWSGGGITCYNNSSPAISGNTVSGNTAVSDAGGVYCYSSSSPAITNNTISGNTAGAGGGVCCYCHSSPAISSNTIGGNTASSGGGIFCYESSSPSISNNTISANTAASGAGGGISCQASCLPGISGNAIGGNTATYGGGIYCYSSSPTISNNTISDNTATAYGGGMQCCWGASPTVAGNTISDNTAAFGGGIHCHSASPAITGTTISGNTAGGGGGIWCGNGSSFTVRNTIVAFSTNGGGISVEGGWGWVAVSYCDVYGNAGGDYVDMPDQTGSNGNISQDPLFADAGGGDFHLKSLFGRWNGSAWVLDGVHSPCIDAGDPGSAFGNEPMPNGARINMGRWGNTAEASKGRPPTTLVANDASGTQGKNVQLVARLTANGAPLAGRSVSFDIDGGTPVGGTTDGNGIAAVPYLITEASGPHTINAGYAGETTYLPSSDTATLTVNAPAPTGITISPDPGMVTAGGTIAYTALDSNGADVTTSTVFYADAAAKGSWAANVYTSKVAGSWTVTGVYGGLVDTAPLTVNVGAATGVAVTPATATVTDGDTVNYTCQATDAQGNKWDATATATWDDAGAAGTFAGSTYTTSGAGTVTISATLPGAVGTAALTVLAAGGNGDILAWDKTTQTFYLCSNPSDPAAGGATPLGLGSHTVGGITVNVTGRAGDMTATVTTPGGISNSLRVRWYLSGGAVYRAYEYSTIGGVAKDATFSAGRTYVTGMGYLTGFWGLDHTVVVGPPASITFGATQQP